jgi:hypothetical protein
MVPGSSPFQLVVPPLQPGLVGPYPVWGTWFSSHLPLEGTVQYPDFLGHNQWPVVLGVQDADMQNAGCGFYRGCCYTFCRFTYCGGRYN